MGSTANLRIIISLNVTFLGFAIAAWAGLTEKLNGGPEGVDGAILGAVGVIGAFLVGIITCCISGKQWKTEEKIWRFMGILPISVFTVVFVGFVVSDASKSAPVDVIGLYYEIRLPNGEPADAVEFAKIEVLDSGSKSTPFADLEQRNAAFVQSGFETVNLSNRPLIVLRLRNHPDQVFPLSREFLLESVEWTDWIEPAFEEVKKGAAHDLHMGLTPDPRATRVAKKPYYIRYRLSP